jgi:H+/gluconate symporter-like permease
MIGIFGIILSLALLIYLAYRGINVLFLAPVCAMLAVLIAGNTPMLGTYTQVFMVELGKYLAKFFPIFMLGAIFGKLMDDSGSARVIAEWIADKVGAPRALLAIVLACAILTYGGVSLFVVAFAVFPVGAALLKKADMPKRLIPGAIALGSFTFTMTALPGTPSIQNAIPGPFFGTTPFAAPGLGIIGGLIMFVLGMLWLSRRVAAARRRGEGYGTHDEPAGTTAADRSLPPMIVAILPIFAVIGLNYLFSKVIFPGMDTSFAGSKNLSDDEVARWQQAFEAIKADGTYGRIVERYRRPKVEPLPEELLLIPKG